MGNYGSRGGLKRTIPVKPTVDLENERLQLVSSDVGSSEEIAATFQSTSNPTRSSGTNVRVTTHGEIDSVSLEAVGQSMVGVE